MRCHIDADILAYECAFGGEYLDEETGERVPRDFSDVQELLDQKIREIEDACWANEPSVLFLTGDEALLRYENKKRRREGLDPLPFKPNFRIEVARSRAYKDRKSRKPYHFHNIRAYMLHKYDHKVAWGMEADDLLAICQAEDLTTIICSRDKDLMAVPGMLYSWECGQQPGWGPSQIDRIGSLSLPKPTKVVGTGLKWFFAQVITGDAVDTIPGLPRGGPTLAYNTLKDCETEEEMYEAVANLYEGKLGEGYEDYLQEQINLLHMVREVDGEGNPVLYRPPVKQV